MKIEGALQKNEKPMQENVMLVVGMEEILCNLMWPPNTMTKIC
jgi:hypothetical protein